MIKSMTAFAGAEESRDGISVTIELRGVNNRYLDIAVRMPSTYANLEEPVKQAVSAEVQRGRVEIRVTIKTEAGTIQGFEINESLADAYHDALCRLKSRYNLSGEVNLDDLARVNGVLEPSETRVDLETVWQVISDALSAGLSEFNQMREKEGNAIAADVTERIDRIESALSRIEDSCEGLIEQYRQRLTERIHKLTDGMVEIDSGRIAQEAAFIADKSDISEEIVRAKSHLVQFRELMTADEPAGKPLNFLLQEFNREFNTMGAKAGNADISHIIVAAKTELEKIREQVQNVE